MFNNYKELRNYLANFTSTITGKYPHQYKTYYLDLDCNAELRIRLEADGLFKLHTTNSGWIIREHQIVAFYFCGGREAMNNKLECRWGEVDCHHISSNTFDNHPSNLVYIPSQLHAVITKGQRFFNQYLRLFSEAKWKDNYVIWNKKGL